MRAGLVALAIVAGTIHGAWIAPAGAAGLTAPASSACPCCATGGACPCGCQAVPAGNREPFGPREPPQSVSCACGQLPAAPPNAPMKVDVPRTRAAPVAVDPSPITAAEIALATDARAQGPPPDLSRLTTIVQLI